MAQDMPMDDPHQFVFDGGLTYNHGLSTSDGGFGGSDDQHGHLNERQQPEFVNGAFTGTSGPSQSGIFIIDTPQTSASILRSPYGVRQRGPVVDVPHDFFDGSAHSAAGLATRVNPVTESPAEAITVDGLVSTFTPTNIMCQPFEAHTDAASSQGSSAVSTRFSVAGRSRHVPITLNFTTGQIDRNGVSGPSLPNNGGTLRGPRLRNTRRTRARQPDTFDADAPPVQGPLAPPQRQGAPLDYKRFGGCDAICQYCHALFWPEEKRSGMSASATPQYQRCCASGRVIFRRMGSIQRILGAPYVFRVSGQIYHFIGGFCPSGDHTPRFLQMYIYDADHEVRHRLSHFEPHERRVLRENIVEDHEVRHRLSHFDPHERRVLRENIVEGLIEFLNNHNALVHLFCTARDKLREADIPEF
ncbi:hypothetical protein CTI12_AA400300 [Artemisia annua]|uniref:Helitron helicase-like domain-containing protein n=1 Tax=Artemisia annua TaxID=35608 RepID=A0A2U1MAY6_ARTAN|nr:hypothetical protein CTI12_AA400300 [Artemisia annua]